MSIHQSPQPPPSPLRPGSLAKPVVLPGKRPPIGKPSPAEREGGVLPSKPKKPEKSAVETIKEQSNGLRGGLAAALRSDSDHFEEVEKQLVKFHGSYQQDDRDQRKGGKTYSFMIRSKLPGGRLTAEQYLLHDEIADRYGQSTLRITTRQDFQIHGVIKRDLQATIRALNESLITTLGACGDVVRNVVFSPAPATKPYEHEIERIAGEISRRFLPRTRAYHEIWLDGEKITGEDEPADENDPIYGKAYLPRKFKIGIAYPGDNSIDVYAQDVGLIALVEDGRLVGFNLLAGGGLGMTHKKSDTFPRLADPVCFVTPEEAIAVIEQIVLIHRDYGDRSNRRHARLKYVIHEWGLDRFKDELQTRLGYPLKPIRPTRPLKLELYLGWHALGEGRYYLGISVENGRIKDEGNLRLKSGLREIVSRFRPSVSLTPNQDILLTDLREEDRPVIDSILEDYGIRQAHELSNVQKYSMACPALPTCGLAISEAERALPGVIDELEETLEELGLADERLTVRMTGCPNGCARPYVADIGFVGRSLDQYTVYVGGRADGTRLNQLFQDLVPLPDLVSTLRPLLELYARERIPEESFGDFCNRAGIDTLRSYAENHREYAQAS